MNYRLAFSFLLSLICLLGCRLNTVLAQQTRMTEEEVNTEKIFIEASREKVLGNYENAAILYKEVLKRDNQNDAAAYELARMYEVLDKDDKALSSIIMAIAIDGKNPWYRMFLADLYDKAGQVKKAAAVYEELSATEPNNSFYLSKWALYLMKDKDYQNALVVYDKVQAITGINEELARKKHAIFLALNEPQKAADVYKELLDFFPYEIKYHHYLAEFYKQNGKEVLATEVYKKILKLDPNDAKAQLALAAGKGNHQENSNNYIEKLKPIFNNPDIEAAAKIKEMMPLIHRMIDNNNWDMGTQLLNLTKLLEKNHPDEVGTYTTAGDILFHLYRKREALDKYQKALALEKGVYGLWEKVLSILAEVEDYTQLKKVTNEALDYFPNHARIYYYQGIAAFHQDQKEQAIRAWKQAMIMSRKNENLQQELHFRLGLCYEAQGNNQKAAAA
ncbi:MAG TPA: tetratricopeptide repeat protein, partial [Phaeodactylibacter sp.]|nr:tetratricopeptide repeat protein [Phaeodactylibacter sp.]